jgi:hypothetical protein
MIEGMRITVVTVCLSDNVFSDNVNVDDQTGRILLPATTNCFLTHYVPKISQRFDNLAHKHNLG